MLLKQLDNLNNTNKYGISKKRIYKDSYSFEMYGNYIQKIIFSIEDLNKELKLEKKEPKDILYMIMLANRIKDTFNLLLDLFKSPLIIQFKKSNLNVEKDYLEAIRSFVVAHPMNTTRHKKFDFDGSFICSDILIDDKYLFYLMNDKNIFNIDLNGLNEEKSKFDYLLKVYSKENNMRFFKYICCSLDDLTYCVSKYINELYSLARYLKTLKRKEFKNI